MDNRDLEKDKLKNEQQPKDSATEPENEHVVEEKDDAVQRPARDTASNEEGHEENRQVDENTKVFEAAPLASSDPKHEEGEQADSDTATAEETKVFSRGKTSSAQTTDPAGEKEPAPGETEEAVDAEASGKADEIEDAKDAEKTDEGVQTTEVGNAHDAQNAEDAVDSEKAEATAESEEAEETKVYRGVQQQSSLEASETAETGNNADGAVDLSQDTIVSHPPLKRTRMQSRSAEATEQATDEESPEVTEADEAEKDTREKRNKRKKKRKERIRLIPIWLRVVIVILLCGLSLIAGLMFGYGIVGNGTPSDILQRETWEHIYNIISGAE
ncbi:DNA-directed RNA polymerase subunit beta [Alkalihalobacterium elongatum]|uniref:DNA-directed RNA polymerase subunit beta n=1 Tax=Alkalihalobacterium elongatum TaxID=2675466 RepID=UPI001F1931D8|nr:DNA-directed RNA polymerase subunit beta [Alkalihalobacterium elongatum]